MVFLLVGMGMNIEYYMKEALKEAKKAYAKGEVPVGCVIVENDKIIARGHNLRESKNDPTCHAEIVAIRKACKKKKSWRLENCDIYVTIEPCSMCAGTLIWTRIRSIYYGATDKKGGALGSSYDLLSVPNINHHPLIMGGILKEEASLLMTQFFKDKRNNK